MPGPDKERGTRKESRCRDLRCLEVESQLPGYGSRRYIVRAAESRKEVVKCILVGQVNDRELCADLVFVAVQQVVVSDRHVKEMSRRDTGRILVVILSTRSRNAHKV